MSDERDEQGGQAEGDPRERRRDAERARGVGQPPPEPPEEPGEDDAEEEPEP